MYFDLIHIKEHIVITSYNVYSFRYNWYITKYMARNLLEYLLSSIVIEPIVI